MNCPYKNLATHDGPRATHKPMDINYLINHTGEWLKGKGSHADIVISSRVRLARNLARRPFPNRAQKRELEEIMEEVRLAVDTVALLKKCEFIRLNELDQIDKQILVERHLMSHEHAGNTQGKALVMSRDEAISIMVNEEDHMRIQVMQSGLNLDDTFALVSSIDDELSKKLNFGYSLHWGYLTACPTNTGTGMRGSVMLHLPALVMTKQINKVLTAVNKLSFTSRGFYGEGTQASGNFYQISNQVSMGQSEIDIIQNINGLIRQIVEQEEQARQALLLQNKPMLQDKIYRSYGILKNSFLISSQETVELLSMVRLGIDLGIVTDVDRRLINDLFIRIQPAHLQKIEGKKLNASDRDAKRASVIRERLLSKGI